MFIDSRDLRLLAAQGMTMAEIARELKQPYFRVRKSCQLYGVDIPWDVPGKPPKVEAPKLPKMPKAPKPPRINPNAERNAKMATMYRQGLTLEKIAGCFDVTRERVRQILAEQGMNATHGGQRVVMESKSKARQQVAESKSLARYGLSCAEVRQARADGHIHAFRQQRRNADARGINWNLTLGQWLQVWRASGKLAERGRSKGKYVMSRIKDSGGYEIGNVHIQLLEENSREAISKWIGKHKENRGVFLLYPGAGKPWLAKYGRKLLGLHATEEEAVAAREKYMAEAGVSPHGLGRGRGWTYVEGVKSPYQVVAGKRYVGRFPTEQEARAAYLNACANQSSLPTP